MNHWSKFNSIIELLYFRVKYRINFCIPLEMVLGYLQSIPIFLSVIPIIIVLFYFCGNYRKKNKLGLEMVLEHLQPLISKSHYFIVISTLKSRSSPIITLNFTLKLFYYIYVLNFSGMNNVLV